SRVNSLSSHGGPQITDALIAVSRRFLLESAASKRSARGLEALILRRVVHETREMRPRPLPIVSGIGVPSSAVLLFAASKRPYHSAPPLLFPESMIGTKPWL